MTSIAPGTDSPFEYAARLFEAPARRWPTPGDLAAHINPATVQTPALDLIDAELAVHALNLGARARVDAVQDRGSHRLVVLVGEQHASPLPRPRVEPPG